MTKYCVMCKCDFKSAKLGALFDNHKDAKAYALECTTVTLCEHSIYTVVKA